MKKILLTTIILLVFAITLTAQDDDTAVGQPFESISLKDKTDSAVIILKPRDGITGLEVMHAIARNDSQAQQKRTNEATPCDDDDTGTLTCIDIPFGRSTNTRFKLPRRWESFEIAFKYKIDGREVTTFFTPMNRLKENKTYNIPRTGAVWLKQGVQGDPVLQATFKSPIDARVKISLIFGDNTIVAEGSELLVGGKETPVILKQSGNTQIGQGQRYAFKAEVIPTDLPVNISITNPEWIAATNGPTQEFKITNQTDINTFKLVSDSKVLPVRVSTQGGQTIKYVLNGRDGTCNKDQVQIGLYNCSISANQMVEGGANKIKFTGLSAQGRSLEDNEFQIAKDTIIKIEDGIRMKIDNNDLVISYKLARALPSGKGTGLRISATFPPPATGAGPAPTPPSPIQISKPTCDTAGTTCSFNQTLSSLKDFLGGAANQNAQKISLNIKVISGSANADGELTSFDGDALSGVVMDLIQPSKRIEEKLGETQIQRKLERTAGRINSLSKEQAVNQVKQDLAITDPNQQEEQTINYLVEALKQKTGKKNKFFQILKFVGKTALAYVGFPLPI